MFVTLSMLMLLAIQFAIIGAALAGGAWVVWRFLEQAAGRRRRPMGQTTTAWSPRVFLILLLGSGWAVAGWLAVAQGGFAVREGSPYFGVLRFLPFAILLPIVIVFVWLLRRGVRTLP
jgi:O-antigen ligase